MKVMTKYQLQAADIRLAKAQALVEREAQRRQSIVDKQVNEMIAELSEKMDTVNSLVKTIQIHRPDFKAPWVDGCRDGKRVYANPNVTEAIAAVLPDKYNGRMSASEIADEVLKTYPAKGYAKSTILQALSKRIGSLHRTVSGFYIYRVYTSQGYLYFKRKNRMY